MLATALSTPLPRYRLLSPSRSSKASRVPVEAPDGAQALPMAPDSRITSAITVGLPRESITSKPLISTILLMGVSSPLGHTGYRKINSGVLIGSLNLNAPASASELHQLFPGPPQVRPCRLPHRRPV